MRVSGCRFEQGFLGTSAIEDRGLSRDTLELSRRVKLGYSKAGWSTVRVDFEPFLEGAPRRVAVGVHCRPPEQTFVRH